MSNSDDEETQRRKLFLVASVRSMVRRRLTYFPRQDREEALATVEEDVYLRLEPDTPDERVLELAVQAIRRIEAENRRNWRHFTLVADLDQFLDTEEVDEHRSFRVHLWEYLDRLLAHLSDSERLVVESFETESMRDTDIAGILGWSPEKVRKVRSRAKRRLRELVEHGEVPKPPDPSL